ncbi:hypothetical protein SLS64_006182 [Diaporthe eres]
MNSFSTLNKCLGMFLWGIVILGIYCSNTWATGYLPINSNRVYDHFGELYNVSRALDDRGLYDHEKYMDYSAAYLSAANSIVYCAFFGIYTSAITHVILFHRYEITMGFKGFWASIRRKKTQGGVEGGEYTDVHNRLMAAYPEGKRLSPPPAWSMMTNGCPAVSEWWYLGTLLVASAFGFAGVAGWPTYTTPGVVPYGVALALVFVYVSPLPLQSL